MKNLINLLAALIDFNIKDKDLTNQEISKVEIPLIEERIVADTTEMINSIVLIEVILMTSDLHLIMDLQVINPLSIDIYHVLSNCSYSSSDRP